MQNFLSLLLFILVVTACADEAPLEFPEQPSQTTDARPEGIRLAETGHHKTEFEAKKTIAFDMIWSNRAGLKARLTQRIDGSAIHIRYASGTQAWWDSRRVWLLPVDGDTISEAQARFDLRAWHYWSCLPYKLSDPGVSWQVLPDRTLDGQVCSVGRLSFSPGTGDTPDDWFAVFTDREQQLVRAAIYVATFGHKSAIEASKTPQMIRYLDYRDVAGIPIATRWLFSEWETDSLAGGATVGTVRISNIKFGVGESVLKVKI